MQRQTTGAPDPTPVYRVEFSGAVLAPPLTIDAPANAAGLAALIHDHITSIDLPHTPFDPGSAPLPGYAAGWCGHKVALSEWRVGLRTCERCPGSEDITVDVDLPSGTARITDDVDGTVLGTATITGPGCEPAPDYWTQLAAQLRTVADQLGTLTGSGLPAAVSARVTLSAGHTPDRRAVPIVDAIAARLGLTATTGKAVGLWEHAAREARDPLTVDVYCSVPALVSPELVEARAEIERLRAEIAAQSGGVR